MCLCACLCLTVCMYVSVSVCVSLCICVSVCVSMCVCVCMYNEGACSFYYDIFLWLGLPRKSLVHAGCVQRPGALSLLDSSSSVTAPEAGVAAF